jgi:hypothetical protein
MSSIKTDYLEINTSKSDGNIHNFKGQFIGLDYLKWTNKDVIVLANRIVEFKDFEDADAEATAVDLSGILSLRLTAKTELSSAGTLLFNVDLFNEGVIPSLEDLGNGLVTKKISLNHTALNDLIDGKDSEKFIIQYSGQDAAGNPFTFPSEGITVTLYEGADQDDAPNNPEPPATYLTTNEILRLVGGVADIAELTAIAQDELFDRQVTFVESEQSDYWYDADAITGDHAPDDQADSTGFWKLKGNITIQDNLEATTDPGASNDDSEGYSKKSVWINNTSSPREAFRCLDASTGAAVWVKTTLSSDELAAIALSGDKADIGLGNVNNTSDADKPVSTAQQTALDLKQTKAEDIDLADTYIAKGVKGSGYKAAAALVISSGSITQTQQFHTITNESGDAADDLTTFVPAAGQTELFLLLGDAAQIATIKHGTGVNQPKLVDDADLVTKPNTIYHFHLEGTSWYLVGSSATGGGSGGGGYQHSAVVTIDHTASPKTFVEADLGKLFEIVGATSDVEFICDPGVFSDRTKWVKIKNRSDDIKGDIQRDDSADTFDDEEQDFPLWKSAPAFLIYGDDNSSTNMDTEGGSR